MKLSEYFATGSYLLIKQMKIPMLYQYFLIFMETALMIYLVSHDMNFDKISNHDMSSYHWRDIILNRWSK